ncbi:magnesium transporter [Verrucomicrobiota bacterium]
MPKPNRIKEQIFLCIERELWEQIPQYLEELRPADLAEIITAASPDNQNRLFSLLSEEDKPDVLAELEGFAEDNVLENLSSEEVADLAEEMAPDDAADLLHEVVERSEEILDLMEEEESDEVRGLMQYADDTAGGLMTTDYVAVRCSMTAGEAIDHIVSLEMEEPFYYAYVVDRDGELTGWVQLWELLKPANREKLIAELREEHPISVYTGTDQEEVARFAAKYDLSSLPVLNARDHLVGRVTVDDIIDVIEEEASEDIFKFAGSSDEELEYTSPFQACKVRLPWLLITLATGFLSSLILKNFNHHLGISEILVLNIFVPIIMAMGGNTGIQSSTLIIRRIAVEGHSNKNIIKLLTHEIIAGATMGIICGSVIGLWSRFVISGVQPTPVSATYLATTVGLALFSAMTFAAVFGALVPTLLDRMEVDPAVASGPFVSASNDILALLIYYGVTLLMLGLFA